MSYQITATTKDAYDLFHRGSLALAEAEYNGIRIDQEYCERMIANLEKLIESRLKPKLAATELGKAWAKRYGRNMNYGSDDQLRQILYKDLQAEVKVRTKGGKTGQNKQPAVNKEALIKTGREDIKILLEIGTTGTNINFLKNILKESQADGYIHPFFHLASYDDDTEGGATSFRGSSSHPNFQNNPNRHEGDRKLVRSAIIPREGHRIVGRDYGGIEVCISACNHQDPNMIRYIERGDDMHRDVASMCFMLDPDLCTKKYGEHGKQVRQTGKNGYTFPQFYFQEFENTAKGLWMQMLEMPLVVPNDPEKTLQQHLADKGIRNYDAFEQHIVKKVCPEFWEGMFPGYWKWRLKRIEEYHKNGYFDMLTGFRVTGVVSKYQLGNFPIQGPAFHCLLWSMIEVVDLWKGWSGHRSKVVGQIHDELTTDEHGDEFHKNQEVIPRIMSEDIRKHWKWIIVPLSVETDATPVDGNWYTKKGV